MKHGFVRVGSGIPEVRVADTQYNVEEIEKLILKAQAQGIEILVTPELGLTGSTCQDLFLQQTLTEEAEIALMKLMDFTRSMDMIIVVGLPVDSCVGLLNLAVVLQKGKIMGAVEKTFHSTDSNCAEKKWFRSISRTDSPKVWLCGQQIEIGQYQLFHTPSCSFAIEIGSDFMSPLPPSQKMSLLGAELILNPTAEAMTAGKTEQLQKQILAHSSRCMAGIVHANAGFGESSTDCVFGASAMVCEMGNALAETLPFCMEPQLIFSEIDIELIRQKRRRSAAFFDASEELRGVVCAHHDTDMMVRHNLELTRQFSPHPFFPDGKEALDMQSEEIFSIQTIGLAKRLKHANCKTVVIGISGGLDSTLALLVAVNTFDRMGLNRKGIVGITMPGFGTSDRTYTNALTLMKQLGITQREVSIKQSCLQHFSDIGHNDKVHDVTYENAQARERTQILMDIANMENAIVVGTGDLSELALGWATYNGDHMSMYCVNGGVPKTVVRHVVAWYGEVQKSTTTREILRDIVDTPISPELIPANEDGEIKQKTEDLVGPYELHDFFLYYILECGFRPQKIYALARKAFPESRYDNETIKKWLTTFLRRFFSQQFKRSCLPDGPKVLGCSLSPRGDWQMPSDASVSRWLKDCEGL